MSERIGFTGTRKGMVDVQKLVVLSLLERMLSSEAHHGDCIGSDEAFHALVRQMLPRAQIIVHPPADERQRAFCNGDLILPPLPFRDRDRVIAASSSTLIAAPRLTHEELRSGTWATIRDAWKMGKSIVIAWPSGMVSDLWPKGYCGDCGSWGTMSHSCWRADRWLARRHNVRYGFTLRYINRKEAAK